MRTQELVQYQARCWGREVLGETGSSLDILVSEGLTHTQAQGKLFHFFLNLNIFLPNFFFVCVCGFECASARV